MGHYDDEYEHGEKQEYKRLRDQIVWDINTSMSVLDLRELRLLKVIIDYLDFIEQASNFCEAITNV